MIDFDDEQTSSTKSVAIQKIQRLNNNAFYEKKNVNVQSYFVSVIIVVFCFPHEDETIKNIYEKYKTQKCFVYQNLTDTDSTSLLFVFICNLNSQLNE